MKAKKKLTLEVSEVVQGKLEKIASLKNQTVEQYAVLAIIKALRDDELSGVTQRPTLSETADRLRKFQKEMWGDRVLSDSAEDIRQAREERIAQLEGRP